MARLSPAAARAQTAEVAARREASVRTKWGYTLLGVSLAIMGVSYAVPYIQQTKDMEKQRLYSAAAVFWVIFVVQTVRTFVWSTPETPVEAPAAQVTDAEDSNAKKTKRK